MGHLRKINASLEQGEHFEGFDNIGWWTSKLGRCHITARILEGVIVVL